ncbi:Iron sulfur cluster assembly protein 1, mitochondrial [Schizosaccharomyces pombe]
MSVFRRSVQCVGVLPSILAQRSSLLARPANLQFLKTNSSKFVPQVTANVSRRMYHKNVLDHYNNPRNVGTLPKGDPDVGIGLVGAPACGDVMRLAIRVNKDGVIEDVKFKTFGCGSAIASSSYVTTMVKGMTLEEASKIKNTQIAKELCLPPVKLHCSMLAEDAIKSAVKHYRSKQLTPVGTTAGATESATA